MDIASKTGGFFGLGAADPISFGGGSDVVPAAPSATGIIHLDKVDLANIKAGQTLKGLALLSRQSGFTAAEALDAYDNGDIDTAALILAGIDLPADEQRQTEDVNTISPDFPALTTANALVRTDIQGSTVTTKVPAGMRVRAFISKPRLVDATLVAGAQPPSVEVNLQPVPSQATNSDGSLQLTWNVIWSQNVVAATVYGHDAAGAFEAVVRFEKYKV